MVSVIYLLLDEYNCLREYLRSEKEEENSNENCFNR
ncbi:MAG: hypothetical protein IJ439_02120 [Tyzzerella sp.]|nr:hypothetical protein [Tyzzerella sp.]